MGIKLCIFILVQGFTDENLIMTKLLVAPRLGLEVSCYWQILMDVELANFILVAENLESKVLPTWQQTIMWLIPKLLITLLTPTTQLSHVLQSLWLLETLTAYGCHSLWLIQCCKIRYN
jgi:hypothetical protein